MSGPEISLFEKSILGSGLWSGLDCEIKGSGPIMSNFTELRFVHFLSDFFKAGTGEQDIQNPKKV